MTHTKDRKHRVVKVGGNRLARVRRSAGRRLGSRKVTTGTVKKVAQRTGDVEEKMDGQSDVLTIEDEEAQKVLSSVSSETALGILRSVHDDPKIPKNLADELNVTVQNVRYHLNNLEEAGLVKVGDTCYSEKGREMSVYEPSRSPSVLVFGKEDNEVQSVLSSVHETPKTPNEISEELSIPIHRVEHHLEKLKSDNPSLVESRRIHERAVVWSATEAGIKYLSDSIDQELRIDV